MPSMLLKLNQTNLLIVTVNSCVLNYGLLRVYAQ